jgi:hypothetical protein
MTGRPSGMGPGVLTLLKNRDEFLAVQQQMIRPSIYSFSLSRFILNVGARAQSQRMVTGQIFPHPRLRPSADMSPDTLRQLFEESNAIFRVCGGESDNPPLQTLKLIKGKETVYFDASGCFFPNEEPFKHFGRFTSIRYLTLSNCGFTELPSELATLPEKTKFLDLSMNYLSLLPVTLKWKLFGLNLSENAFGEWPVALAPEHNKKLGALSFATNPLQSTPAFPTGFAELKFLDLSQTKLVAVPVWIEACEKLRSLKLSGSILIKDITLKRFAQLPKCSFLDLTGLKLPDGEERVEVGKPCRLFIMKGLPPNRAPLGRLRIIV